MAGSKRVIAHFFITLLVLRAAEAQIDRLARMGYGIEQLQVQPNRFHEGGVKPVDRLAGTIGDAGIRWSECCELRLDYKLDRLWLLMEPRIYRDVPEDARCRSSSPGNSFARGLPPASIPRPMPC
jgi:hypothetical protein